MEIDPTFSTFFKAAHLTHKETALVALNCVPVSGVHCASPVRVYYDDTRTFPSSQGAKQAFGTDFSLLLALLSYFCTHLAPIP